MSLEHQALGWQQRIKNRGRGGKSALLPSTRSAFDALQTHRKKSGHDDGACNPSAGKIEIGRAPWPANLL